MPMLLDTLLEAYGADLLEGARLRAGDVALATARQRDGAAQDMRVIGGAIAAEVLRSDDPAQFAGLNAGVRIPTTLDQPGSVVSK